MSRSEYYRLGVRREGWRLLWTFECNLCGEVIACRDWRRLWRFDPGNWPHYEDTSNEYCNYLLEEWIEEGLEREGYLQPPDWREKYPYNFSTGDSP
jgi:hypothetical protein